MPQITKYDRIIERLSSIDVNVAHIEGHLKEINNKVSRNVEDIKENKEKIDSEHLRLDKIDKQVAKWLGGAGVLITVITLAINYFM